MCTLHVCQEHMSKAQRGSWAEVNQFKILTLRTIVQRLNCSTTLPPPPRPNLNKQTKSLSHYLNATHVWYFYIPSKGHAASMVHLLNCKCAHEKVDNSYATYFWMQPVYFIEFADREIISLQLFLYHGWVLLNNVRLLLVKAFIAENKLQKQVFYQNRCTVGWKWG